MTASEKKTYDFIVDYVTENLYAPSIREICEATGFSSSSSVYSHLYSLQHDGYIKIGEEIGQPRSIKLLGYKLVKE